MTKKAAIEKVDDLLKPLGFHRRVAAWNREAGHLVEVIETQVSKAEDTITVNAGVLDRDVYLKLWGSQSPEFIDEPACTVRARVGELVAGKDLWWSLTNERVGEEIVKAIIEQLLPFLKRMHSRQDMVQWLTRGDVIKKKYPLPIINLAILQNLLGESSEACALLANLEKKIIGAWRTRVVEVAERLGCRNS
ncbi:MAG TPA: DUF4304 domain-containing protein [Rhodanobacteraceae bacterium]